MVLSEVDGAEARSPVGGNKGGLRVAKTVGCETRISEKEGGRHEVSLLLSKRALGEGVSDQHSHRF